VGRVLHSKLDSDLKQPINPIVALSESTVPKQCVNPPKGVNDPGGSNQSPPISIVDSPSLENMPNLEGSDFFSVDVSNQPDTVRYVRAQYNQGLIDLEEVKIRYFLWVAAAVMIYYYKKGETKIRSFRGLKRGHPDYVKKHKGRIFGCTDRFVPGTDIRDWNFLTFTCPYNGRESLDYVRRQWNKVLTLLKYYAAKFGRTLHYFRVFELQQRGSVHIHVVLHGLRYFNWKRIRKSWGENMVCDFQKPKSIRGITAYMMKYLNKTLSSEELPFFWLHGARQYSMNFPDSLDGRRLIQKKPKEIWGLGAIWWFEGDLELEEFSKQGYTGWKYWFEIKDFEMVGLWLRSMVSEIKRSVYVNGESL